MRHSAALMSILIFLLLSGCSLMDNKGQNTSGRKSGLFLNVPYEYKNTRYVFHDSSVDIYFKLQDFPEPQWIVEVKGAEQEIQGDQSADDTIRLVYSSDVPPDLPLKPQIKDGRKYYSKSELNAIAKMKPGEWYLLFKNTPSEILEHNIKIAQNDYKTNPVCSPLMYGIEYRKSEEDAFIFPDRVLTIENEGLVLTDALHPTVKYVRK